MSSTSLSDSSHPIRNYDTTFQKQSQSKFEVARALATEFFLSNPSGSEQKDSVWRFEEKSSSSGVTVWSRPGLGDSTDTNFESRSRDNAKDGIRLFRTVVTINCSAESVFDSLRDPERIVKWHPSIETAQPLYNLDDSSRVSYLNLKPQMGGIISARHSVDVLRWGQFKLSESESRQVFLLAGSSIPAEIDQDPANGLPTSANENKKKVRSITYLIANAVVPISANQCQVVWFIENDIKGWLTPSRTLGPMVSKNIETLKSLKAFCEK